MEKKVKSSEEIAKAVNPPHYRIEGRKQCIDEMIDVFGYEDVVKWAIMTAYKYQYRCGKKDAVAQEKGKIKWYEKWSLDNVTCWMNGAKDTIVKYFKAIANNE